MPKSLLLCDCAGSQPVDTSALSGVEGIRCSKVHTALCTAQAGVAAQAIAAGDLMIACAQEQELFSELAIEANVPPPEFVDLRDRAGWSDQAADAGAKMAALTAEALLPGSDVPAVDVMSEGICLIAGPGDVAGPLARQLADVMSVTLLITDDADVPETRDFDVIRGRVRSVSGAFAGFDLRIDALQQVVPGGRGGFELTPPQDGAQSACDIIVDLTGGTPMVPAPDKREGYLRADPRDPLAVAALAFDAAQLTGTFEKPLYVRLDESLCAHSRAQQAGCSKCLDICPTGAITPDGDHVAIDPMVCAGCGSCAALCPSTAITYQAPEFGHLTLRMRTLAQAYQAAGGSAPRLLVHDDHGAEMIRLAARFGRGLPADVIPFETPALAGFGHSEMLSALAVGFGAVEVLLAPTTERDALMRELDLARALSDDAGRCGVIDLNDPDALSAHLYDATPVADPARPVLPMGNRRQAARMASQALNPTADAPLVLPVGAPYGAVVVDTDDCTLCLSCVSLCPSGALIDNPDMPQLRFQEDACLQCGLCTRICPEDAITLKPQMDLSETALTQRVLHEEEPFACVECGALFGVKSTIERIKEKLAGNHPMFATSDAARMISMCDNCRVNAQFHSENNPFQADPKPKVRTTEDYLSKRRDH